MSAHPFRLLGQSGFRLEINGLVIYMDPYLSNSVQELDSPDLERLIPVPIDPDKVTDANFVIISHVHIDHCDPQTIPSLAVSSPNCRFIGPKPVLEKLISWGIDGDRCFMAKEEWMDLDRGLRIVAVPAAHPEITRDANGNLSAVGFVLEIGGKRCYMAGDTSIEDELLDRLHHLKPISFALLPVNEHNYYRGRRNIVGNMSVRDAFGLAEEIGISLVVPVHWDMFAANSVSPDEIMAIYRQIKPRFDLEMNPAAITL